MLSFILPLLIASTTAQLYAGYSVHNNANCDPSEFAAYNVAPTNQCLKSHYNGNYLTCTSTQIVFHDCANPNSVSFTNRGYCENYGYTSLLWDCFDTLPKVNSSQYYTAKTFIGEGCQATNLDWYEVGIAGGCSGSAQYTCNATSVTRYDCVYYSNCTSCNPSLDYTTMCTSPYANMSQLYACGTNPSPSPSISPAGTPSPSSVPFPSVSPSVPSASASPGSNFQPSASPTPGSIDSPSPPASPSFATSPIIYPSLSPSPHQPQDSSASLMHLNMAYIVMLLLYFN